MGNTNLAKVWEYNKYEDPDHKKGEDYCGPFTCLGINNFQKETEEYYKDKSLIEYNIEKMKRYKNRPCIGRRLKIGETKEGAPIFEKKYTYYTYSEVLDMCKTFAKNIHELKDELLYKDTYNGIDFNLIGIFAKNCTEWVISDLGCQMDTITTATLYATMGQEAFKYICEQTKIKTIFVSPDLVDTLCDIKKKYKFETLTKAILFDMTTNCDTEKEFSKLSEAGFATYSFKNDFMKENSKVQDSDLNISTPDTIMTICYTSGTTGDPKGVMLSQRNLISVLETVIKSSAIPLNETSCHISYLPMAHIFERMVLSGFISVAARIGFISGSVRTTLMEDMSILKPTLLCFVPRVMQTIRTKVFDGFNALSGWKKKLAYKAYHTKLDNFHKYGVITHTLYDVLVFKKIRQMFGGKVDTILCASAPMQKALADDFKIFLSVPINEGFGMTELAGSAFCTCYHDLTNYTSGGVTGGAKLLIKSVKDLGYTVDDVIDGINCPAGEICVKGPLVFKGYYKNDAENKRAFDEDGYFHTGDVCRMFPNFGNGIKIVDRVKEIFKLSQGEYIIPAKLESAYSKSFLIAQIMIYGNSSMNNIVAIIVPDKKHCAEALGVSITELVKDEENPKLKEIIIKDLDKIAKESDFNGLEKVKYVILTFEGFTIENSCMSPTMKIVRKKVELKFKDRIDELYKSIPVRR